ncbi:hypothetical protein GCM10009727_14570 [Actinomadura napierensis]|uniref:Uncharacterized protein n=1 Tax=Actinomadura napierensis TaxID=267854 RepID=A0ABP5K1K7_9ACTN
MGGGPGGVGGTASAASTWSGVIGFTPRSVMPVPTAEIAAIPAATPTTAAADQTAAASTLCLDMHELFQNDG